MRRRTKDYWSLLLPNPAEVEFEWMKTCYANQESFSRKNFFLVANVTILLFYFLSGYLYNVNLW